MKLNLYILVAFALFACSMKAWAINADFTDGNSATQVDGYVGMAGPGWLGAWQAVVPSAGTDAFTNSVKATSPLGGGGNYLSASLAVTPGVATGAYPGAVARKFDPAVVSNTAPYSVSFKIRLDTAMANQSDALNIFGDVSTGYVYQIGPTNTWLISGYNNNGSPVWTFYDGNRAGGSTRIVTNVPLVQGTVYSFVVNVDPVGRSWTVAISDGITVYQSSTLGFRNAAPTSSGNGIYFAGVVRNTTGTIGYSLDALGISSGVGGLPGGGTNLALLNLGLNPHWQFSTDPSNQGLAQQWYGDTYDDSSWGTMNSGSSWEDQGLTYGGYAWYRQKIVLPASYSGVPVRLNLADIFGDDDVYINGVRVGGISGNYKYQNLSDRQYMIPASLLRYGQSNTIAIRTWGGNFGSSSNNSGLVAGTYTMTLDPYPVMAHDTGAPSSAETPVQLYDLSAAQQGRAFDLVFRYPSSIMTSGTANLTYTLKDFYGASIQTGTVPVSVGADNVVRGIVNVSLASSQAIYLGGRFVATLTLKDGTSLATLSNTTVNVDHLSFKQRDITPLPALTTTTYDATPYGTLKLIDTIDCSLPSTTQDHPYMQGAFGNHAQDYMTPGAKVTVPVNTILGKQAREPGYGWFAYRIGRGGLTPGKTYLLRIEYPEDKARYCPVEVQAGNNYMDIGWKNGVSSTDVYDNWPLSNTWQYYDAIIPLGDQSTGTGGTADSAAQNGLWVYVMNKMKPGIYFKLYAGGPAVATMKLYEIDPAVNAPAITPPPAGLPQRTLMFDWERQAEQVPGDLVNYAKLMGYNAISPIMMKWALDNYGDPTNGYDSINIDDLGYWVQNTANPAQDAIPGVLSVHQQYLAATKNSGVNYIPRFEYGGSNNLPTTARAINSAGGTAQPNRFSPAWCANLLDPATYTDLKGLLDNLFLPYAATNPQLKGALWRIREDRMQVSYGPNDIAMFCADTGTTQPVGYTNAQLAAWASSGTVGTAYSTWWQGKRVAFHQQVVNLMKSYRSDMTLYYYNWDPDKFSMMRPDINSATFYALCTNSANATSAYNNDRAARATYTAADYINVMTTGNFSASGSGFSNRPDYALLPSLYTGISGIELLAPSNYLCYASLPDYLNYFQTSDGLAVSNCVSYDEIASREPNPKYECNMITPGGSPFSMALELLAYYHGDARTLTYTAYTYGRGFADAHRRFAQAFLALPAVPGVLATATPTDVAARVYTTASSGTYIGIAYKGYTASSFTVSLPGSWTSGMTVTNLVTGVTTPASIVGGNLQIAVNAGPMELNAYRVSSAPPPPPSVVANFTSGVTTTQADGYTGVAGGGWLGPWTATVSGCTFSNTVLSTTPLGGGGNYLKANLTAGTAAGSYSGAIGRKFDTTLVNPTAPYTITYKIRLDSAMTIQSDSLLVMGDVGTGYIWGTGANNTWAVSGYYNNGNPVWSVLNGDRAGGSTRVVTTMPLVVGTVYTMVVNVDPTTKSWTVSIDNGTTQYTSGTLGFRTAATTGSGNSLYFGAVVRDTTGTLGYSVDSLSIAP